MKGINGDETARSMEVSRGVVLGFVAAMAYTIHNVMMKVGWMKEISLRDHTPAK
jgi:hypothetical protein